MPDLLAMITGLPPEMQQDEGDYASQLRSNMEDAHELAREMLS